MATTQQRSTLATIQLMFPNAWSERDNPDYAIVNWGDAVICVGPDDDRRLMLCIYTVPDWGFGNDPGASMPVETAAEALEQIDWLTETAESYDEMINLVLG